MPATHSCSSSLSAMTRRSKENVEIVNNSDYVMMASGGKFDSTYVKEHLDCFTFLCKQFIKQDNTNNSINNLKMVVENCQNMVKLMDSDVDVNLMLANLETLKDYLKEIYVCYENV